MAKTKLVILLISLLLLPLALANVNTEVAVEGMVYCQACKHVGTWSLSDAKPIPYAKINVNCKDSKGRVEYNNDYEADHNGYFFAELKGFKMEHYILNHPIQACKVRLVSSSQEHCSVPADVNHGLNGSSLSFHNVVIRKSNFVIAVYETGPLAFSPNNCSAY